MEKQDVRCILEDVPDYRQEYPDFFSDALGIALSYSNPHVFEQCSLLTTYRLQPGHRDGIYGAISTVTGRGWLNGFDEAAYYWEQGVGVKNPNADFAVSSLPAYLLHYKSLQDAIRFMDHEPEFLWNQDCTYSVDPQLAAGFIAASKQVGSMEIRRHITQSLTINRRPVIVLLYLPSVPAVEVALITGFEDCGEVIMGRSPCRSPHWENPNEQGLFRLQNWESDVLAVLGIGSEKKMEWHYSPCYIAIENALRLSRSCTEGTLHYGLALYDAWERALLDEQSVRGVEDHILSRRLLYHSMVAGLLASQKAFTVLPPCEAPGMGIISGLVSRAAAGPGIIHGLMWDVWQIAGGYWRGIKSGGLEHELYWENDEELRRFRERSVREQSVAVIRKARQVDAQALQDLQEAKEVWDSCLGHGKNHPCPCWGHKRCIRYD